MKSLPSTSTSQSTPRRQYCTVGLTAWSLERNRELPTRLRIDFFGICFHVLGVKVLSLLYGKAFQLYNTAGWQAQTSPRRFN